MNLIKRIVVFCNYINFLKMPARINRSRAWIMSNIYNLFYFIFEPQIYQHLFQSIPYIMVIMLFAVYGLFTFVAIIIITIKRLHDLNLSGWWICGIYSLMISIFILFNQVPLGTTIFLCIFIIALIVLSALLLLMPGTKGDNKFGTAPKKPKKIERIFNYVFVVLYIIQVLTKLYLKY